MSARSPRHLCGWTLPGEAGQMGCVHVRMRKVSSCIIINTRHQTKVEKRKVLTR